MAGELSVRGNVALNGASAISGATVFNNGTVRTDGNGAATINLGKLGRIELQPGSEMTVNFTDNTIGGTLRSGRVTVSAPMGVAVSVMTTDGAAVSNSGKPATVAVAVTNGKTIVSTGRGETKVSGKNVVETLSAGEEIAVCATCQETQDEKNRKKKAGGVVVAGAGGGAGGMSAGAVAALVIAGVAGATAGVVAASQSDATSANSIIASNFRP
ncbi:MAG: hypothetical protein ACKV2V_29100 [Blastocatellia bacterium]